MSRVVERNPHALALIATIEAAGVDAGDTAAPHDIEPTDSTWTKYVVLYLLPGGEVDGSIADPECDVDIPFQITGVGRLAAEARWVADKAGVAVTTQPVTVAGRQIQRVRMTEGGHNAKRDDDITPPLFYVTDRYVLTSRPA